MVKFKYNEKTKNIKLIDSYKITDKRKMIFNLNCLPLYKINRSQDSCLNEWIAHNRLYRLGLFRKNTKDCDLTANESKFRRLCYWILSRGYRR